MQFSEEERAIFNASTFMMVSNGTSALFWENRWLDERCIRETMSDLFALPKRHRKQQPVQQALREGGWIT
jgi:hypothetical protein